MKASAAQQMLMARAIDDQQRWIDTRDYTLWGSRGAAIKTADLAYLEKLHKQARAIGLDIFHPVS